MDNLADNFRPPEALSQSEDDRKKKTPHKKSDQSPKRPPLTQVPTHNLQEREIFLDDSINKTSVKSAILQLRALARQNKEPITLHLNSPGGSVYDGLALYDTMRELMNDGIIIKTKAYGLAASMGSFLLSAGTPGYRSILPTSRDMTHQPSRVLNGSSKEEEIQNAAKSSAQTRRRMEMHYLHFMGLDYKDEQAQALLKEYMSPDVYLNAFMAKKLGLVDHIAMVDANNKPDGSLSQEFLKRSIEIDAYLNEVEYDEIDTSPGSTDPLRHVKKLVEYREQYLAVQTQKAVDHSNDNPTPACP
ncbi:MAG: ATP-dependent Clp protease proteolytic subunit [Alphaproteobacteria bacterium]